MFPGTVLLPIGCLIAGWTSQAHIHWIAPDIVSLVLLRLCPPDGSNRVSRLLERAWFSVSSVFRPTSWMPLRFMPLLVFLLLWFHCTHLDLVFSTGCRYLPAITSRFRISSICSIDVQCTWIREGWHCPCSRSNRDRLSCVRLYFCCLYYCPHRLDLQTLDILVLWGADTNEESTCARGRDLNFNQWWSISSDIR